MRFIPQTAACLRVLSVLQLMTGLLTFIPLRWLEWWHRWLGLHAMPDDAVLRYALRGGALVQAALGVLFWIMASDVVRYRPLVIAVGAIFLVCGPGFFALDMLTGMPWFWSIFDGASCFSVGAILLAFAMPNARA